MESLIFVAAVCSLFVVVVFAAVDIAATSDVVVVASVAADVKVFECLLQLEHGCFRAKTMLFAAAAGVVYG